MKIAIQGERASFHDQAARTFFDDSITTVGFETFDETFAALANDQVDFAVVAIENSIHGAINETLDLLSRHNLHIHSELYLHIEQCLVGLPDATPADVQEVYSHFAALSQCREYLDAQLPHAKRHVHPDTAGAVADVKQWHNVHRAAISGAFAAKYHGLKILAANIETDPHNYTRFVLLGKQPAETTKATKVSLLLQLHSQAGALHAALGVFAAHNLDLTMLVSRPVIGKPGDYQFYIDLTTSAGSTAFAQTREQLAKLDCTVRLLGSYTPLNTLAQVMRVDD